MVENNIDISKVVRLRLNQSASESSKNNTATNILNKTEDIGKKIAGGLGSLLGNASQKLKEGSK